MNSSSSSTRRCSVTASARSLRASDSRRCSCSDSAVDSLHMSASRSCARVASASRRAASASMASTSLRSAASSWGEAAITRLIVRGGARQADVFCWGGFVSSPDNSDVCVCCVCVDVCGSRKGRLNGVWCVPRLICTSPRTQGQKRGKGAMGTHKKNQAACLSFVFVPHVSVQILSAVFLFCAESDKETKKEKRKKRLAKRHQLSTRGQSKAKRISRQRGGRRQKRHAAAEAAFFARKKKLHSACARVPSPLPQTPRWRAIKSGESERETERESARAAKRGFEKGRACVS